MRINFFKKCLVAGIILVLGGVAFPCDPASQGDVCVVLQTLETFTSIQDAIDDNDTSNGHTIIVVSGKCIQERITVNKSVIIQGEVNAASPLPIIDGECSGNIITVTVSDVTIENLVIENYCDPAINGCDPANCGALYAGIKVQPNPSETVQNVVIRNNTIRNCPVGIYFQGNNGDITDNKVYGNDITCNIANYTGIIFTNSSDNMIYSNNIVRAYAGNSLGDGILLMQSSGNTIIANTLEDHGYGIILVQNSDDNIIHHNNFLDSVNENAIIDNTIGSCDGNQWDNGSSSGGNYWSDHTCTDSNSDGICENAYTIPGSQSDQDDYPLANQWVPVCGNVDGSPNNSINLLDIVYLNNYVSGGAPPIPPWVGDVDGDCDVDIDDVYYLLDYIYYSGSAPQCCSHEI